MWGRGQTVDSHFVEGMFVAQFRKIAVAVVAAVVAGPRKILARLIAVQSVAEISVLEVLVEWHWGHNSRQDRQTVVDLVVERLGSQSIPPAERRDEKQNFAEK